MAKFGRRKLLAAGATLGLAAGVRFPLAGAKKGGVETHQTQRDAVVIGSGFGGSVAALRLGQAGFKTAVIERGKFWTYAGPDTFPTISKMVGDGRTTWLSETDATSGAPVPVYTGLMERINGDTVNAVVGAGVGGGSLVFGGVLLQPRQEVFEQVFPQIRYRDMKDVYYPRVLSAISGGTIPDDILNSPNYAAQKSFIYEASTAGLDVIKSHVCFNWNVIRDEIAGRLAPAASIGEYAFGCNSNAKNTLDKNYLRAAVNTRNVSIFALHNVTVIQQQGRGRYRVQCDVITEEGEVVARHVISCKYLFMAAGSINTTKLLLKSKLAGELDVNDEVGKNWGNNGDYLIARAGVRTPVGPVQGGPPSIAAFDGSVGKPLAFMHSPANRPIPMQLHMSMSVPEKLGTVSYDAASDRATVQFPYADNAPSRAAYKASMQKLTAVSSGQTVGEEGFGATPTVWHPLGGCVMGKATSDLGQLYGQRNLFVMDGSLLPGSSAAANPSLTIAANAERIMDRLIRSLDNCDD
jgi:cholesterol oxidase